MATAAGAANPVRSNTDNFNCYYYGTDTSATTASQSAIEGMVESHSIENVGSLTGFDGLSILDSFKPLMRAFLEKHGGLKRQFAVECLTKSCSVQEHTKKKVVNEATVWIRSEHLAINNAGEIDGSIAEAKDTLIDKITESRAIKGFNNSRNFEQVLRVDLGLSKYKPLKGGTNIALPKALADKKAILNNSKGAEPASRPATAAKVLTCDCGQPAAYRVSQSQKNPGRRFRCCGSSKNYCGVFQGGCGFFAWDDDTGGELLTRDISISCTTERLSDDGGATIVQAEHDGTIALLRAVDWATVQNTSRANVIPDGERFCHSFIFGPNMFKQGQPKPAVNSMRYPILERTLRGLVAAVRLFVFLFAA